MTPRSRGFTLVESLFGIGLVATLACVSMPQVSAALDDLQAHGAARYVAARLQHTRLEAVRRNANTALRFTVVRGTVQHVVYVDGNGNGVSSRDIQNATDRPIGSVERLSDQFPGARFGALPGLPAVDPGGTAPGSDPIRFGSSDMAVFTAAGSATPGSVYIRSRGQAQYVVRVFGDTGKTRILKFHARTRTWRAL